MDDRLEFRLAAGDAGAVGECYRAHAPAVRSFLRRMVPHEDVDDVLQVVFTEVWRSRHRFDPSRSLPAWLYGIARKRAVDHLRARRPQTLPLDAVADPAGPDGRVEGEELADRDRIRRALDELPAVQRQAIELAYYGDLTQREIADRLRVPLGTVKARTARGLHRLAALLPRVAA
ncbi:sigma-70 family RNA polymerase sigma factor [Planotetraspora phitsanulokensis]|uniref:RNA polymerase sigma factor n=1 Tax=Planotetraspora phitsanulokensis TaxID=575192 RepID=A0A8J3UBQ6_9ACTN|nr:sigma-70 family RNA polymerase sigma factor [Planotetraspora phitsanulokensis]GII42508.1 RNA polymerase sigma factor [Planotetraspora phitsanulokensis]